MNSLSRFWFAIVLLAGKPSLFAQTDLAVAQRDAPDPLPPGANITYTLNVLNLGPNAASTVLLSDPVPAPGNNSDTETTLARTPRADMGVTTIDSPDPVFPNSNITYNVTLTNHGLDMARNVTFNTSVPANTTYVSGPLSTGGFGLATDDLNSSPYRLTDFFGLLLFAADEGPAIGRELWKSDGTTAGTARLIDINPGSNDAILALSVEGPFVELGGFLYFAATDPTNGNELWKSDGTANGTAILKNIRAGSASSSPVRLTKVGNTIFFRANDGSGGKLWKTDGTPGGTVLVKNIFPGTVNFVEEKKFVAAGNLLFFTASDPANGAELWTSDGTDTGTMPVKDINPGVNGSDPDSHGRHQRT